MSAKLKPFQLAAVEAGCGTLMCEQGPRRFLIADEVGLGKTVVAREIVRQMSDGRSKPLIVYYVANGQRVANQNRNRIIDFLPEPERKKAISRADRIGLIPLHPRSRTRVALYALTPGTSFPGETARLYAGRKEERAFMSALLGRAYPHLTRRLPPGLLQRSAVLNWDMLLARYRREVTSIPRSIVRAFRAALKVEFDGDPRKQLISATKIQAPGRIIGRMRRALAHAVLLSDPPDLIILDEFQRYRFLVSKEGREDRLVTALLSSARRTLPAVLLLSATPYKLFATRWEESQGVEAHHELFELVEFLGGTEGSSIRTRVEILFQTFGDSIRRIASTASDAEGFTSFIIAAEEQRRDIHQLLSKLMSRTERATADVDDGSKTEFLDCDISGEDVHAFRHLVESFQLRDRSDALPYWLSVPLPAQALGQRYQAWRNATFHRDGQLKKLSLQIRNHIGPRQTWPHPKLRAMQKVAPTESLSLPWAAPSLPWWPLSGPWANALPNPKVLLFSRFKATPQSIAALTSFAVESAYLSGHPLGYERVWRKRRLQPGPGRLPLMALFHPSGFLIERIDPLKSASYELRSIRASVRQQLIGAMKSVGVNVQRKTAKHRERRRPTWSLVSALDNRAGFRNLSQSAWSNVASTDRRLYQLVAKWHAAPDVDWVSPRELEDLVTTALGAPGVVVGRALLRHYNKALTEGSYSLVRLSWSGLRVYLDNPIFWSRLGGRKAPTDTLIHAVVDGGLESVLDEHFWTLRQASPTDGTEIADELCEALNVVTGSFSFHVVGRRSKARIRIRCHAAVPFGGTEQEPGRPSNSTGEQQARSDELRKAFNAPFWPYVLATTSVGQEGLDFHTWCSRVAHWDLCYGPLDLEQREGRIQRFAGLLVRQQLAASIGKQHTIDSARVSPWCAIARIAECERSDSSGLSPWWVLAGAGVTRYVFRLPQGRDVLRFSMLREQRFVYRLALGQPNQEDFLDMLTKSDSHKLKLLRSLALDLSAFNHQAANGVKNTMRAAASAPNVTV